MGQQTTVRHYDLSEKDTWQTPEWLLDCITNHCSIDLDPCAGPDTSIAKINWCIERGQDGLERDWTGIVFVNPPFGYKNDWTDKVIEELSNTECIFLLTPASTDVQSWWHGCIAEYAEWVWFSHGRVKFIDPDTGETTGTPPFGTAVSAFGDPPVGVKESFAEHGWVVSPVE